MYFFPFYICSPSTLPSSLLLSFSFMFSLCLSRSRFPTALFQKFHVAIISVLTSEEIPQ